MCKRMVKNRNIYDFCPCNSSMFRHSIKLVFLISITCLSLSISAQTEYRNQELTIIHENDVYTLLDIDQYYSNGIIFNYRFIPRAGSFFRKHGSDSVKRIIGFGFQHKFFTPIEIETPRVEEFDRPYAGTMMVEMEVSTFTKPDRMTRYGVELGIVGKASGGEALQTWYHNAVGFPNPRGWDLQIKNEPVINFKGEYNRQFKLTSKSMDLISYSRATVGTMLVNTNHGFDIRLGRLRPLNNSAFKNSLMGKTGRELVGNNYFFLGYGVEYVLRNTLIEGSMWNIDSPHTEEIVHWIRHWRVGWTVSSSTTTFKMVYYRLSKEVVVAKKTCLCWF